MSEIAPIRVVNGVEIYGDTMMYIIYSPRYHAVKVGHSYKPRARMASLCYKCKDYDLQLLCVMKGGKFTERKFHVRHKAYRRTDMPGVEWFSIRGSVKTALRELLGVSDLYNYFRKFRKTDQWDYFIDDGAGKLHAD